MNDYSALIKKMLHLSKIALLTFLLNLAFFSSYSQNLLSRNTKKALHRGIYEISLNSSAKERNPYYETQLVMTFSTPDGKKVMVDGFCDGGTLFKARAYCSQIGRWRWFSSSNDPAMDGNSGEFDVVPSQLWGKLRIHPHDPYQFAYENGEWFLHIGDTGYRFVVASEPYWKEYIDQAAEMGATKIRTWFAMERSSVTNLFAPDGKTIAVNYWKEIERRIIYTLENHPHISLQLIPYAEDFRLINKYAEGDPASLLVLRYAQARWSSFPNIQWTITNDTRIVKKDILTGYEVHYKTIDQMGKDMAAREPWGTLITNHQARGSGYDFYNESWSDIVTLEDLDQVDGAKILEYRSKSKQPVVNDEDRYEIYRPPMNRRYFFRRLMWASLLSGGHATYGGLKTYEARGDQVISGRMERLNVEYIPYEGIDKGIYGYYDANKKGMLFQGAHDFNHIRNFFKSTGLTLVGMKPNDAFVGNDPFRFKCIHNEKTHIIYLANPSGNEPEKDSPAFVVPEVSIQLAGGTYEVKWFDPNTGTWVHGGKISGGNQTMKAPGIEDWILLINKK